MGSENPRPDADGWRSSAACLGHGDAMFPELFDRAAVDAAKAICADCPVADACLDHALANYEQAGIWAGRTPAELTTIRRSRAQQQRKPRADYGARRPNTAPPKPIAHGTPAGADAHRRQGTAVCDACRIAHNDYKRRWRQERGA